MLKPLMALVLVFVVGCSTIWPPLMLKGPSFSGRTQTLQCVRDAFVEEGFIVDDTRSTDDSVHASRVASALSADALTAFIDDGDDGAVEIQILARSGIAKMLQSGKQTAPTSAEAERVARAALDACRPDSP